VSVASRGQCWFFCSCHHCSGKIFLSKVPLQLQPCNVLNGDDSLPTCTCKLNNNNSFVCKKAPWRTARHHALNDLIARILWSLQAFLSPKNPRACHAQMSGRPHFGAMERGQTPYLGHNCRLHCGRLLCERFSQRLFSDFDICAEFDSSTTASPWLNL